MRAGINGLIIFGALSVLLGIILAFGESPTGHVYIGIGVLANLVAVTLLPLSQVRKRLEWLEDDLKRLHVLQQAQPERRDSAGRRADEASGV